MARPQHLAAEGQHPRYLVKGAWQPLGNQGVEAHARTGPHLSLESVSCRLAPSNPFRDAPVGLVGGLPGSDFLLDRFEPLRWKVPLAQLPMLGVGESREGTEQGAVGGIAVAGRGWGVGTTTGRGHQS